MKKLNLNSIIKVKLNDHGKEVFYHQYDDINKFIAACEGGAPIEPSYPDVDADGYTEFQLWNFIHIYGKWIMMGVPNVIEPLNIYIEDKDLEEV